MDVLSICKPVLSGIQSLLDEVKKIKDDDYARESLNITIIEGWKVLEMVGKSQLQGNVVSALENEIKNLIKWCYDLEDILDEIALKLAKHKRDSVWGKISGGIPNVYHAVRKSGEIDELQKRFINILGQWKRITEQRHQSTTSSHPRNGTHALYLSMSPRIIGREDDIQSIQKLLLEDGNKGISIIGMCGLGKSILARTIFNHEEIVDLFSSKKWVYVTEGEFVWDNIKAEIEQYIEEFIAHNAPANNNQRYNLLIVFDNLLRMRGAEWDNFSIYRRTHELQSIYIRIIITTRYPRISGETQTTPYYLETLSDGYCEEVIKENAKLHMNELFEPRFLYTVKSVAKKCEGLPWVAERFGNIIAKCHDRKREAIEKAERLWQTPEFNTEILPQLMQIYIDMKLELRRCIAYFSLFPANYHFNAEILVHLWVGECFVQLNEKTSLKQIEEKYIDDLKESSILQYSGPSSYKLHCFGKDFSMLAASGTCLHLDQGVPSLSSSDKSICHLSLSCKNFKPENWSQLENLRKLRTFLSVYTEDVGQLGKIPPQLYRTLSCLRVLSLQRTNVDELPIFIDRLKHLRYLDISFTPVTLLPRTFSKLHVLQFLKLKNTRLTHLPRNFHKLSSLRSVDWEERDIRELGLPCHIGKLSHLESLPLFEIGERKGYSIRELGHIKNLQGSICIENLQLVANTEEAKEAMLDDKCDLRRIVLQWITHSTRDCALDEDILTGLQPHNNLKELKIINYGGDNLPEWISNSMVEKIQLMGCRSCFLPALGKLKCLKTLVLEDMESVTHVSCRSDDDNDTNSVCFPSLESLEFHNMTQLTEWRELQENDMPHLRKLKFVNCPNIDRSLRFINLLSQSLTSMSIE